MITIQKYAVRVPDLRRPSPPEEASLWEVLAVIFLGLVLTGVGMAAALVAFAEKIDAPRPPDPWGNEAAQTSSAQR
jgi:hypothetical protein